ASFEMDNWESDNWYQKTFTHIKKSVEKGAVGIKIWKNIGMEIVKSSDHTYLMIDDLFFDPLFKFLSENKIPLLAHLGEPKNCWLPLEEMTSDRNRLYYTNHPEFHAYLHPEIPNYDLQIQARDSLLAKFPDLVFVGAHLGSLEWSYEELSKRFDKYPDFKVDLSSRLGHLQMQSAKKYDGVRDFFMKYADRIIYGTDAYNDPEKLTSSLINDWKFLSTDEDCESTEVSKTFKGIQLPEEYLYKIYYENAIKTYNGLTFEQ
ncbi:MAG: amidohydrolase family protein, partial [Dysgonamonadaceae bacterium]